MLDEDLFLYSLSLSSLFPFLLSISLSLSLYTLFPLGISADIFADINRFFHVFIVSFIYFFSSAILDSAPLCHLPSLSTCSMYSYDYKFIDSRSSALTSTTIIPPASRFADCRSRDRIGVTNLGNESSRGKSSEVKKQGGRKREKQRD